jgi:DNA ligase (NAD+)
MIISVGYRVNSKKAVEFRKWASGVLKDYLLKGYSINHRKIMTKELDELKQTVLLLSNTLLNQNLVNETGSELLGLIKSYAKTWDILVKYDEDRLELPKSKASAMARELGYEEAALAIMDLKTELSLTLEASNLFGQERGEALDGIIGNLYQTFGGDDLYPSIEEKAAHLIYFIIKDHPFSDGNKRIGCLLFLLFLNINGFKLTAVTPESLTALALLIAESDPTQKEIIIKLVINLLSENG